MNSMLPQFEKPLLHGGRSWCGILAGFLALVMISPLQAQTLDAFDPNADGTVYCILPLPDGKVLVGGNFNSMGGQTRNHLARLNADGSLDAAFNPNLDSQVYCIAVLPDGKYMLGGVFSTIGGVARKYLARLNSDGTLDASFNAGIPGTGLVVRALVVQPDGKVIVGGSFTSVFSQTRNRLARLNADGTLDSSFNPNLDGEVRCLARQPDGKVLVAGTFSNVGATNRPNFARLNSDGTLDSAFNTTVHSIETIAIENYSDIVIGGQFTTVNATTRNYIARLKSDGSLDTAFNPNASSNIEALTVQADGKILVGGGFASIGGGSRARFARLNPDGSLDSMVTSTASSSVQSITLDSEGRIYLGGSFTSVNGGTTRNRIGRLTNTTTAVQTFSVTGSTQIDWQRSGSAQELEQAAFEYFNGSSWVALGNASRITGGWRLSGLSLPISGQIRGRGRPTGGQNGTSAGIIEQVSNYTSLPLALQAPAVGVQTGAAMGESVAVEGNYAVAGSWRDDTGGTDSGVVKVFSTATGALLHIIPNPSPMELDEFGMSVAISGTRVVVGAGSDDTGGINAGSVYVYDLASGTPSLPVLTIHNPSPNAGDRFGESVAISGTRIVVGTPYNDAGDLNDGSVYVYDVGGGTPTVPVVTLDNPSPQQEDYFGQSVSISGTRIVVGAFADNAGAENTGSAYVYDLTSGTPTVPTVTLNNTGGSAADYFGWDVAVSGSLVVVAERLDDTGVINAGRVLVYDVSSGTPAVPLHILNNPTPADEDYGYAVSISGTRVVVGAHNESPSGINAGIAYVYDLGGGTPTVPVHTLNNPTPANGDNFGYSVAISGTKVLIGTPFDDTAALNAGSAYIYELTSGTPTTPTFTLNHTGPASGDNFGYSVSFSGSKLVVGAANEDTGANDAGSAHIFDLAGGTPGTPILTLNNPSPGDTDRFGWTVAADASRVVVGAFLDDRIELNEGSVYVYDIQGATPTIPSFTLSKPVAQQNAQFGYSVAVSGNWIAVGCPQDSTSLGGAVYVFDLGNASPNVPVHTLTKPGLANSGAQFGHAVAMSGNRLVVGAYSDDTGASDAGAAYVYDLSGGSPATPIVALSNPSPHANDYFGYSVSISGTTVVIGAERDDESATDAGRAYVYDIASGTPTLPAYTLLNPAPTMDDFFGTAVAVSGTQVVIGAKLSDASASNAGIAYLFNLGSNTPAIPVSTLVNPSPQAGDSFGNAVAASGSRLAIAAFADATLAADKGAVYTYDIPPPQIVVEESAISRADGGTLDLGVQAVGTPLVKTLTVRNTGGSHLNALAVTKDGMNAGDITLGALGSVSLAPYASTTFTVTFTPAALGNRSAAIHIASDVSGSANPFDITLTGVGAGAYPAAFASKTTVPVTSNGFTATGSTVNLALNYAPTTGDELMVVNNTSKDPINGTFSNLANGQTVTMTYGGVSYDFVAYYYGGEDYNDLVLLWKNRRLVAWGFNSAKQLGDNTSITREAPVAVNSAAGTSALAGKDLVSVATGSNFSIALCTDGIVLAWGQNGGQLGDNSNTDRGVPVAVNTDQGVSALYGKRVVAIAAGGNFSMALSSDGTVVTWGNNQWGQLGNGTQTSPLVPVAVSTAAGQSALYGKKVARIATGTEHCLALTTDGTLVSWGSNSIGQLGDDSTTFRTRPVLVNTASGTSALFGKTARLLSCGQVHNLVLCTDGTLVAWGGGGGKLGDNSTTQRNAPVFVNAQEGVSSLFGRTATHLASSERFNLVLTSDGSMSGWGNNSTRKITGVEPSNNEFLVPTLIDSSPFTPLLSGASLVKLAVGEDHSLALTSSGTLIAWGSDGYSQLGDGAGDPSMVPVTVSTASFTYGERFVDMASSFRSTHSLAIVATPPFVPEIAVEEPVGNGLADGTASVSFGTATIGGGGVVKTFTVQNLGAAPLTGLAVSKDGTDSGDFVIGSLGATTLAAGASTTFTVTLNPTLPGSKTAAIHVSSNDADENTFDITLTGTAQGPFSATFSSASDTIITTNGFTATSSSVTLALNFAPTPGTHLRIVNNTGLPFIQGTFSNLAQGQTVALPFGTAVYNFVANYYGGTGNDLVLVWAKNRAFGWGANTTYGAVGDGTTTQRNFPVPVLNTGVLLNKTVLAVAARNDGSLVLCSDGTLASWGNNSSGDVGDNSTTLRTEPVAVNTASGVSALFGKLPVAISVGGNHSLVLCSDGTLAAWGTNQTGVLGFGASSGTRIYPTPVSMEEDSALFGKTVVQIASGTAHNLALCSDGTLVSWGGNAQGQLGINNAQANATKPVLVNVAEGISALYGKSVVRIAAGGQSSFALCSDGTFVSWGDNDFGQLGDNSTTDRFSPVLVNTANGVSALFGKTVTRVSASIWHAAAVCSDGTVVAWGRNGNGQVGDNSTTTRQVPSLVNAAGGTSSLAGRVCWKLATGSQHTIAICADGSLSGWGSNSSGQCGINGGGSSILVPNLVNSSQLSVGEIFTDIFSGCNSSHSLAIVASPPPPPTVMTLAATSITGTSAVLNGTINANGSGAAASFDYGTSTGYGSNAAATPAIVTGDTNVAVSATLTGLQPETTYFFRARGTDTVGSGLSFTTLSANADLASLALSSGSLSPAFDAGTISYTASVGYRTYSLTVTPTKAQANATITVNGVAVTSGAASGSIPLSVGPNVITTVVTAQDGTTTKTYTVTVTRAAASPGDVDEGFSTGANSYVRVMAEQPDGKMIIGGAFTDLGGTGPDYLARLGPDGSLDTSFTAVVNEDVFAIAVMPDGKVLIGGWFSSVNGQSRPNIARLNSDGSTDTSFNPTLNNYVYAIYPQPDGKILVGGSFTSAAGTARNRICRLNADGTLDTGFNPNADANVNCILLQPDGKILLGGNFNNVGGVSRLKCARLLADGSVDAGFEAAPDNAVFCMLQQPDGKILIGGQFSYVGATLRPYLVRLNSDGTLDAGYSAGISGGHIYTLAAQADGKILVGGYFHTAGGVARSHIARLSSDGTTDTGFNPVANDYVYGITVLESGRIFASGAFTSMGGLARNRMAVLVNESATDSLSVPALSRVEWLRGGASPEAQSVTFELSTDNGSNWLPLDAGARISGGWERTGIILPTNGQIRARARVLGGFYTNGSGLVETITSYSGLAVPDIAVFNGTTLTAPNERVDNSGTQSFGTADLASVNTVQTFSIRNDGTVALSGLALSIAGTQAGDFTLGSLGAATLAPGASTRFNVTFTPQGFGARNAVISIASNDFDETPFEITVSGTGGNALAASFSAANTIPLTTNGFTAAGSSVKLSLGFAPSPFSTLTVVNNTSANPISGTFTNLAQGQTVVLSFEGNDYRYSADYFGGDGNDLILVLQGPGVLDYTFSESGRVMTAVGSGSDSGESMVVQRDGKIVVAGTAYTGSNGDFALARYLANGALDTTSFGTGGVVTTPIGTGSDIGRSVALQSDGKIIVAGWSDNGGNLDFALVRYTTSGARDTTFGTDGKVTTPIGGGMDQAYAVAVQSDGKILVTGRSWNGSNHDLALVRYTTSGVPDSDFGTSGKVTTQISASSDDVGYSLALQSDGRIVVAGSAGFDVALVCYTTSGALDTTFNGSGKVTTPVGSFGYGYSVAVQRDGKIVVGGTSGIASSADFALLRYSASGGLDNSFGTSGKVITDFGGDGDEAYSLALQSDGKIVLAGTSEHGGSKAFALARYTDGGVLDTSFGAGGKAVTHFGTIQDIGRCVAAQSDGTILMAGYYQSASTLDFALARYLGDTAYSITLTSAATVPLTFDGLTATGRTLNITLGFTPNPGANLKVFENTSLRPINGEFVNMAHGLTVTLSHNAVNFDFVANYFGGDGNDLTLEWANTKLAAFGLNGSGQLGITGTAAQANVPMQVVATAPIYQKTILGVSAGETHSLAVCSDGSVAAWGSNTNGQLGNGTTTSSTTPVAVTMSGVLNGKKVIAVAAGAQHSLALCSDGTLAAWGDGSFGQIGDNGVLDRTAPVLVSMTGALNGKRVIAISAGANHSAVLCSDGTVVCWGSNTNGELGNASNTQSNVPVAVTTSGVLLGRTAVAIACGENHTLALLADGAMAAWGRNASGQLGNSSTAAGNVPVLVDASGLLNGKRVVEIAAGGSSCLARCSDGVLAAWGLNDRGQLGVNNATTSYTTPQAVLMSGVLSGKTVAGLFAGAKHAGALCSDGTLATWGEGNGGELGDNAVSDSLAPVLVNNAILGGTDVFAQTVAGASAGHSLALIGTATNAPMIQVEHLGNLLVDGSGTQSFGSTYVTSTRTKVFTIQNLGTRVLSGIAATINGTVANIAHYSIPAQPPTSLQPGEAATFAVNFTPTSTGSKPVTLRIANNLSAPLNPFDVNLTGTASPSFTFTFVTPSDVAVSSTAFNASSKTITLLLGHAPVTGANLLVVNNTGTGFITGAFSNLAHGHTVALTFNSITYNFVANYFGGNGNDLVLNWKDTRLLAWGANSSGTLGTGGTTQANMPTAVNMSGVLNGKTIVALACGERHSLALCADNTLAAWGANDQGQLGTGNTTPSNVPVLIPMNGALAGKTIAAIAAGYDFSLALCNDGTVAAWGTNGSGQLGNNSLTGSGTPVAVSTAGALNGKVVTGIAAGYDFSSARCADGTIVAWGANHSGQLGNGTNDDSLAPVVVTAAGVLSGRTVTSIAAGNYFMLALCSDGRIAAWGDNGFGTLGDGTVDPSNVPVLVSNTGLFAGKTPVRIAAGQYHSTALCSDGTLGLWGDNTIGPGQLGVTGTDSYLTPGPVSTAGVLAGKTISSLAAGQNHNIALLTDGTLAAWGFSAFGQLGNGNTTYSELPVLVNLSAVGAGERIIQTATGNTALHTVISLAMPVASGGAPAVTTNAAESINKTTATLKGLLNPNGAATDARFEYGLTTSYGTQTAVQAISSGSNSVSVTQSLSGLQPNTTYHYRITATNSGGTANGNNSTFTTLPDPPVAVNGAATAITNTTAIVNGSVNPNTRATTVFFRVSTDSSFVTNAFTTAPQNISAGSSFVGVSAPLSGLLFGTTYYYRLVAQNAAGEAEDMAAQSFTTTSVGIATQAPTISSTTAVNITTTSARLQGSVNAHGGFTNVFFEYGASPGFGTNSINYSAGSGTSPQSMTHDISGLLPATQYQFRLVAENNFNNSTTTTGTTITFTTLPLPPIVETHAAAALSTTSARLNGKVNAQNGSAAVTFEWGTNGTDFPNSLAAVPSPVTGSTLTDVSVDLANLAQFTTYYFRVKAVSAGGTTTGSALTFQPAIISGLAQQFPAAPPASSGSLTVTLTATGLLSGWRFVGEHRWRASGDTAAGLVHGSRVIEFRPVPGYLQPGTDTVNVTSSGQVADYEYYATPSSGTGGILVVLKPDTLAQASNVTDRGQWRLFGETTWRDSATTASALPAGSYLIECKAVSGYSTPVLVNIAVSSGQTVNPTIVYADAFSLTGTPPTVLSFGTVSTDATKPYGYVGQIRSNSGVGTGFAVKSRVVATAAHVVFDEGTLSSVQGLQWLLQEDAGGHEPLPVTPRGYYLIEGYATQRGTETPGSFSLASRQKDVAALYFINGTDAARNGFAGFLASDLTNNEFLISSAQKMLVGYPVDGITTLDQGRMHATPAANLSFSGLTDRVFATTSIRSTGGNSGGPLCVQHTNGNWYPAAIYLGGATQSIVRAIDSTVIQLFNTAQQSGIDDQGYTGGGITHTGYAAGGTASTGALVVNITPAGTGWRPVGSTKAFTPTGNTRSGLTPGTFNIEFTPLSGYQTPANQSVTVVAGTTQTYSLNYQSSQTPQETWRQTFFGTTANTGNGADTFDYDGDGFTNAQEYAAGTNPTQSGDFFKAESPQRSGNTFSVSTAGKTGRSYVLERSTNLTSWTTVDTEGPLAADGPVTLSDPASTGDAFFYRIRVTGPSN